MILPAYRLPIQPHQLAAGLLRALGRQPGHLILERPQVAAAVARPRHLGDYHPVLSAGDPRCPRFDEEAGEADIETAPATAAVALVVEGTAATADRAPLPLTAFRAHVRHQAAVRFLDQTLQHAVHHTEDPQPYTATRHVVCLLRVLISVEIVVGWRRAFSWLLVVCPSGGWDTAGDRFVISSSPRPRRGPVTRRGAASWRAEQAAQRL